MKPYIFLIAISLLLSSCSSKNEEYTEFRNISEIEGFIDDAIIAGDGALFFKAVDTSNIPPAIVSDIEVTLKAVFKTLKTVHRTSSRVMTFAEFTEYNTESKKEWPEWTRENMEPLCWNYQPMKVILYKFGKDENLSIIAGIVERDGKFVLVSSYIDQI